MLFSRSFDLAVLFSSMVELFLLLENLTVSGRLTGVEGVLLVVSLAAANVACTPMLPAAPLSTPASTIQLDRLDLIMHFPPLPAGGLFA